MMALHSRHYDADEMFPQNVHRRQDGHALHNAVPGTGLRRFSKVRIFVEPQPIFPYQSRIWTSCLFVHVFRKSAVLPQIWSFSFIIADTWFMTCSSSPVHAIASTRFQFIINVEACFIVTNTSIQFPRVSSSMLPVSSSPLGTCFRSHQQGYPACGIIYSFIFVASRITYQRQAYVLFYCHSKSPDKDTSGHSRPFPDCHSGHFHHDESNFHQTHKLNYSLTRLRFKISLVTEWSRRLICYHHQNKSITNIITAVRA